MDIYIYGVLRLVNKTFLLMSFFPFLTLFTFMVNNFSVINGAHN